MIKLGKKKSFVYSVMEADLRKQIREDVLKSGEKLLSESEFSSRYGISRRSVRQALANLTNERLIYSHAGSGCFVAENIPGKQPEHLRIVLILPEVDNAFMNELNHGVQIMAEESGCDLIYQSSGQSHEKERLHILHWLEEEKIDGMILFPMVGNHNTDLIFELKKRNMPFVLVDRFFQDIDTDYVSVDNYKGAYEAVLHLGQHSCKNIAHLKGSPSSANVARYEGYRDALAALGLVYDPALVISMEAGYETEENVGSDVVFGREAMKKLLKSGKEIDAVFACNDNMAIGGMQSIRKMGLCVPQDISVVGFDDLKVASMLEVPLTTVRQPKEQIGMETIRLLLQRIQEKAQGTPVKEYQHIVLKTELIQRSSVQNKSMMEVNV